MRMIQIHRLLGILLVATLLGLIGAGCGPAQVGPDRDAFKAIDALYTAVSLRDVTLTDRCAGQLRELHAAAKLPEAPYRELVAMIDEAKSGGWEHAQGRLASFMEGQQRR
ncbi:hypothetical protein [Aquisphaera insulae]|uniref:hypothetical protein n=1 Tax=Aquisphaera insulae TaxID=2712864 RepID=UPI0020304E4B|nr:hypothetical protein [Aquisphaera insulae]